MSIEIHSVYSTKLFIKFYAKLLKINIKILKSLQTTNIPEVLINSITSFQRK